MSTKPSADDSTKPRVADKPAAPEKVSEREQQLKAKLVGALVENAQLQAMAKQLGDVAATDKAKTAAEKNALQTQVKDLTAKLTAAQKEKIDTTKLDQLSKDNSKLRAEADKHTKESKLAAGKLSDCLQENELLLIQLTQAQEELSECYQLLWLTKNSASAKEKQDTKELIQLAAENTQFKYDIARLTKEAEGASKLIGVSQDNDLLLLQLAQAQEELVEYYEQKIEFEELFEGYKARWERLEKRLPSYVDFGAIELLEFDNVSDIPTLSWCINDYAHSGGVLEKLEFTTLLHDGHPGIGLVKSGAVPAIFVPRLLTTSPEYLKNFLSYTTSDYKLISAIAPIFEQLEASNWQGFDFPANFDASFWRPSLKTLMAQLKALPPVLRYDDVVLKRELINPDYEHLWLEFRGLTLGTSAWRKFEVRLGAALLQPDGFSQYPKFEFPLIDGKTKPFESWFAESYDDSGAKLELRFALDKQAVDTAVLAKLSEADRGLLLRLVNAFPEALLRLDAKRTAIHRPWSTWVDFARGAVALLQTSRASSTNAISNSSTNAPKPAMPLSAKPLPSSNKARSPATSQGLSLTPSITSANAGGMKVLSFHSKPANAKAKTTMAAKAVHNNKKRKEA